MKKREPLEGLNDTISLNSLKIVFNAQNCTMLHGKPKLFLLNGWKEGQEETFSSKSDGLHSLVSENSDFLTLCSSFDNCAAVVNSVKLPPSLFPSTLLEVIMKYRREPIEALTGVVNSSLMKSSEKIIKVNGKNVKIHESCKGETTLLQLLRLNFRDGLVFYIII